MTVYETYLTELEKHKNAHLKSVGLSVAGQSVYSLVYGKSPKILIVGGVHAREYISTFVCLDLFFDCDGVEILPMANPDGVRISDEGFSFIDTVRDKISDDVYSLMKRSDLKMWKANLNAVDINVNFDARWGEGALNKRYISPSDYIGKAPFSEPETRIIRSLLLDKNLVICYHSKGEEIYYGFDNDVGKELALSLAKVTGYTAKRADGSTGGVKDYFIYKGMGVGLTVELGSDGLTHPIGLEHKDSIVRKNMGIRQILNV